MLTRPIPLAALPVVRVLRRDVEYRVVWKRVGLNRNH
jgi:hypothetical protein